MKVLIQRVKEASCTVNGEITGQIGPGLLLFVGIKDEKDTENIGKMAKKTTNLRIFEDAQGKMNHAITDLGLAVLSVPQFTLYADAKKGNRPSFAKAAPPKTAEKLYEKFNEALRKEGVTVETGVFAETMGIALVNDGPVTIMLDSDDL